VAFKLKLFCDLAGLKFAFPFSVISLYEYCLKNIFDSTSFIFLFQAEVH